MYDALIYFVGLLPSVITGSVLYYAQRAQRKRDAQKGARDKAREAQTFVSLELELASAKLSYAAAMAIKRGKPNGEIEEGIKQYEKALDKFREFERSQISKL